MSANCIRCFWQLCWLLSLLLVAAENETTTGKARSTANTSGTLLDDLFVITTDENDSASITRTETRTTKNPKSANSIALQSILWHRFLGDFDRFNDLFENAIIRLPDAEVSERVVFKLEMTLRNIRCQQFQIGNIDLDHRRAGNNVFVDVDVTGVNFNCIIDYRYTYGVLRGGGVATVQTMQNSAATTLKFSADSPDEPPTSSSVQSCLAVIDITRLQFDGDFVSNIIEVFQRLVGNAIESEVEDIICQEFGALGSTFVGDVLELADETLAPYLDEQDSTTLNPLYLEENLINPMSVQLLNLQDTTDDSSVRSWFNMALKEIDSLLGTFMEDPTSESKAFDLGFNIFIRDTLLEDDGSFLLNLDEMVEDNQIFQGHDTLTETTITLNQVKIFGLDSMVWFDSFNAIGEYTLQNFLSWGYLSVEMDASVFIKPSSREDSVLENPTSEGFTEQIQVEIGLDGVSITASLLLAIKEMLLEETQIGPLLNTDNLLRCVLSVLLSTQISGLDISIVTIRQPTLMGFVSPGIDRVIVSAVDAVFEMYQKAVLKAVPAIFQTTVRNIVNQQVIDPRFDDPEKSTCPDSSATEGEFIDFRELFLSPDESIGLGGAGIETYGNLGHLLFDILEGQLLGADENGVLGINNVLINSITESQSGIEGTLEFPGDVVSFRKDDITNEFVQTFVETFEFSLWGTTISNLNTLKTPISVLKPQTIPNLLGNQLTIGPVPDRPLTIAMSLLLEIEGSDSPLTMRNEVEISASLSSIGVTADIIAKITETGLLTFPLKDVLNYQCWLATMPANALDNDGFLISRNNDDNDNDDDLSLALSKFILALSELDLSMECTSCTSLGVSIIPDIVDVFTKSGGSQQLTNQIQIFAHTLASSPWLSTQIARWLLDAPKFCPHSTQYDENAQVTEYDIPPPFPALTEETVDTIFYLAAIVAETALLVFVESHRLDESIIIMQETTNPLSMQLNAANNSNNMFSDSNDWVDWTNLSNNSNSSFLDTALQQARAYLSDESEDEQTGNVDLGANILIRDWLLDDNEMVVNVEFDDLGFDLPGAEITLASLQVAGLDSLTKIDILDPIAPQTLQNIAIWDNLSVDLTLNVFNTTTKTQNDITFTIALTQIEAQIPIYVALDRTKFLSLEIGSFFNFQDILPCVLSVIDELSITQMAVSIGNIEDPAMTGLLPASKVRLDAFTKELFGQYRQSIIDTLPTIFDSTIRRILNDVGTTYRKQSSCKENDVDDIPADKAFIDWRTFFDKETETFGDLPPVIKSFLDNELLSADPDTGMSRVNEILVVPLTKSQSGKPGEIELELEFFDLATDAIAEIGIDSIEVKGFNPNIKNLDTIGSPLELLKPNKTSAYLMDNSAKIGTEERPVQFALKASLQVAGDPVLAMSNEIELLIDLAGTELFAVLFAKVGTRALLTLPLDELTNPDCWLSIFDSPQLDDSGFRPTGISPGLGLDHITLLLASLSFSLSCISCTSIGLEKLPDVLTVIAEAGISNVFEDRIVAFVEELITSGYFQTFLDRQLQDGSFRCPTNDNYIDDDYTSSYDGLGLPNLSYESVETLAFGATLLLQVGVVVVAESHSDYNLTQVDPLAAQEALVVPDDVKLIDFTSLDSSVGEWADVAVTQLLDFLSRLVEDIGGPNGDYDLQVNVLLRSLFLDENNYFSLEFNDILFEEAGVQASITSLRLSGLDTITKLDLLDAIGAQTIRSQLSWKELSVQVVISLESQDTTIAPERKLSSAQEITLTLSLSNIGVSLAALLAMDLNVLGSLELRSILTIKNILPCILSAAQSAALTELKIVIGDISEFSVKGFQSPEINTAVATSSEAIMNEYKGMILAALPGVFDTTGRALINNWIDFYLNQEANVACPINVDKSPDGFVDFRDLLLNEQDAAALGGIGTSPYGDLIRAALDIIEDLVLEVDETTGLSSVNDILIAPLTKSQSDVDGTFFFEGNLFDQATRLQVGGLDAQIKLKASDARIENIDTIGLPLSLFDVVVDKPHEINNTATLGLVDHRPLRFGARILIALAGDGMDLENDLQISLDLHTANLILQFLLKIMETRFLEFPLKDLLKLDCWLATIPAPLLDSQGVRFESEEPTVALTNLLLTVENLNLNISCVTCSSPGLYDLPELLQTPKAKEDATKVGNMLLEYVTNLLTGSFLQVQLDRLLNEATKNCPHSPTYVAAAQAAVYEPFDAADTEESVSFLVMLGIAAVLLIIGTLLLMLFIKLFVQRRHKRWLNTLPDSKVHLLLQKQTTQQQREAQIDNTTTSMFHSPEIPTTVRWIMPVIIVGNIGFFLSGHLSLGATVNIEAELAGERFRVEKFFEFSMAQSTVDIWNAGGRELAIMILIFSGIWPYTKQLISLALWFLPPSRLSCVKRGATLLWLDWLAKWSMIDIFVLVISIAAFRVSVLSPDLGFLPKDFYSIDLLVVPLWGLYANMIAQLISQVSSHFIIHYHRKIVSSANEAYENKVRGMNDNKEDDNLLEQENNSTADQVANDDARSLTSGGDNNNNDDDDEVLLKDYLFSRPHRGESDKLKARSWVDKAQIAVAITMAILVILGCCLPSFALEILGVIGVAVESGQQFSDAQTTHTIFTVIKLLFEEARFLDTTGDYIGLGTLSVLVLFTVLIVPIVQASVLLWHWFRPLTRSRRVYLSIVIEMLQAWQYAEVFVIAIFVASWQLGPVSQFMINSYCDGLNDTFALLVYYGVIKEEDAQCFSVSASIKSGWFILVVASILLALLNTFVMKAVVQLLREQDEQLKGLSNNNNNEDTQQNYMTRDILHSEKDPNNSYETSSDDDDNNNEDMRDQLIPVPVLFVDTFKWMLCREDNDANIIHNNVRNGQNVDGGEHEDSINNGNNDPERDESLISSVYLTDEDININDEQLIMYDGDDDNNDNNNKNEKVMNDNIISQIDNNNTPEPTAPVEISEQDFIDNENEKGIEIDHCDGGGGNNNKKSVARTINQSNKRVFNREGEKS